MSEGSNEVAQRIAEVEGWQGEVLARVRELILAADKDVVEEIKWRKPSNPGGVPVWSHDGIICTGEPYKAHVKLTFGNGASLPDPKGIFNGNLTAKVSRAIDIREGDTLNATAFKALVKAAAKHNAGLKAAKSKKK